MPIRMRRSFLLGDLNEDRSHTDLYPDPGRQGLGPGQVAANADFPDGVCPIFQAWSTSFMTASTWWFKWQGPDPAQHSRVTIISGFRVLDYLWCVSTRGSYPRKIRAGFLRAVSKVEVLDDHFRNPGPRKGTAARRITLPVVATDRASRVERGERFLVAFASNSGMSPQPHRECIRRSDVRLPVMIIGRGGASCRTGRVFG